VEMLTTCQSVYTEHKADDVVENENKSAYTKQEMHSLRNHDHHHFRNKKRRFRMQ